HWFKHQNTDALENLKAGNRRRAKEYRERLAAVGGYDYLKLYPEIYQRDQGRCVYCGEIDNLCIDHLIPLLLGGNNEIDNLALACKKCNSGKSGKRIEDAGYQFANKSTEKQYKRLSSRDRHAPSRPKKEDIDKKEDKKEYAPDVFLTEAEYERLITDYRKSDVDGIIEDLNNALGNKYPVNKFKDHNKTIRNWLKIAKIKKREPETICPDCKKPYKGSCCQACGWSEGT
ncbi:unnamed protein product, partial [marine sediment metagenome]